MPEGGATFAAPESVLCSAMQSYGPPTDDLTNETKAETALAMKPAQMPRSAELVRRKFV